MYLNKIIDVLVFIREVVGKKDMPLYWVEFFLKVAEHGEIGVTTREVAAELGMTQGIASRTVKLMSRHLNPKTKTIEGFDLLVAVNNDMVHRHRQRVYLSDHGKKIIEQIWKRLLVK
jgi:DNA-binding MarR family transcriptional regulator